MEEKIQVKSALSRASVTRIARKAGAQRVGKDAVDVLASAGEQYIAALVKSSIDIATHAGRKMIRADDVEFVINKL